MTEDEANAYESEPDQRDAIRQQIVDKCVRFIQRTINDNTITRTLEERRYLEISVIEQLVKSQHLQAMTQLMRCELLAKDEGEPT